MIRFVLPKV